MQYLQNKSSSHKYSVGYVVSLLVCTLITHYLSIPSHTTSYYPLPQLIGIMTSMALGKGFFHLYPVLGWAWIQLLQKYATVSPLSHSPHTCLHRLCAMRAVCLIKGPLRPTTNLSSLVSFAFCVCFSFC